MAAWAVVLHATLAAASGALEGVLLRAVVVKTA